MNGYVARCFLGFFIIWGVTGCHRSPSPVKAREPLVFSLENASNAMDSVVAFVNACTPRDATTPGAQQAASWLHRRLQSMGVTAQIQAFTAMTPAGERSFFNVLAEIPGEKRETIVLLSHFDTKRGIAPNFQGANDGGSSTGVLLELIRVLHRAHPAYRILAGFLDGEECQIAYGPDDGLHGSTYLARTLQRDGVSVKAVILMDMIGDRDLKIQIPRNSSAALRVLALRAADAVNLRQHVGLFDGVILDDHQPFLACGFPAVDLIDFEYGRGPGGNDYWHTPADTLDKLSVESLHTTGAIVLKMIDLMTTAADSPSAP